MKLKIEVPKVSKCPRCKDIAKVNEIKVDCNDFLNASFICDCGHIHWKATMINFK